MDLEKQLRDELETYDFWHHMSDDHRVYKAGLAHWKIIQGLISKLGDKGKEIYREYMSKEMKLKEELSNKGEEIVRGLKHSKHDLIKRYGKDAEKVMYGRANKLTKEEKVRTTVREILKKYKTK